MWNDTNEMLEQMGYGPEARRQRHEDNMRVLETGAVWGAAAYGASKLVESWKQRRAGNAAAQQAQNLREAEAQQRKLAQSNRKVFTDLQSRLQFKGTK